MSAYNWLSNLFFLLIVSGVILVGVHFNNAYGVDQREFLSHLQKQQMAIQDYKFIVSRSFYQPSISHEKANQIAQSQIKNWVDRFLSQSDHLADEVIDMNIERLIAAANFNAYMASSDQLYANLYLMEGIGLSTNKYAVCSILREQEEDLSLQPHPDPYARDVIPVFGLSQVLLDYPGIRIDVNLANSNRAPLHERDIFQPSSEVRAVVNERPQGRNMRKSVFPFWHEQLIDWIDEADISFEVREDGMINLRVQPTAEPFFNRIVYEATCNPQGDFLSLSRKHIVDDEKEGEKEWLEWEVIFLDYIVVEPSKVRIPRASIRYTSKREPKPDVITMPERIDMNVIMYAVCNIGLTPDDLAIDLPEGSVIQDLRTGSIRIMQLKENMKLNQSALQQLVFE